MSDTGFKPRTIVSRLAALAAAGLFTFTAATVSAQTQPEAIIPSRITQAINPQQRVTLKGNVHPLAQAKFDQGAAQGSMATGRIMLVLKRSDAQENALRQFLGDLQNPNSANYRRWVTPAAFGQRYGVSDTDLTTVTAWLQSQGFKIEKVPQAHNVIIFSGNVAQIQQAFNTTIHRYAVNGETHFANSTNPQIPAALAPVVAGIASLNDFRPRMHAIKGATGHYDAASKTIKPDFTLFDNSNNPFLFVNPADAATIYNTPNSNLNANYSQIASLAGIQGQTYDGTGVTIGIVGDGNITMADIANYRTGFLGETSAGANLPTVIVDGNDPGINGDSIEAMLDNEVAGALAPKAKINYYVSADTDLQTGLFNAIYRALDDNQVSILNVSFGLCEAFNGTDGNLQILAAWEQAAAQGISVTVSTGDSGSAGCDDPNSATTASNGLNISGLSSTPFNIAVGGTDFDILGTSQSSFGQYVTFEDSQGNPTSGKAPYWGTAKTWIPENPWNDSTTTNTTISANAALKDSQGNTNIVGAGGGLSNCVDSSDGPNNTIICNSGYAQPSFQANVVPSSLFAGGSPLRAVPDISLFAADELYQATWVLCSDNVINGSSTAFTDCENTNGTFASGTTFSGVGGTSAAAPAFAGMLALVSQSQGGARLGQANYVLYNLYKTHPTIFHDVTVGNISVPCGSGSANCGSNGFLTGYGSAAGYDAATGLGSVDVSQLISNWANANFTNTDTTLTVNGSKAAVTVTHGTTLNFAVSVNPGSASGDVAIVNNGTATSGGLQNGGVLFPDTGLNFLTLSNGTASDSTNQLPGGQYMVSARYGGDTTNAASTSQGIMVNIASEPSTTVLNVNIYDPQQYPTLYTGPANSIPYGYVNMSNALPTCTGCVDSSGNINTDGVATGTVNFLDNNNSIATANVASNGIAAYGNFQLSSQSFAVGTHSITAKYSGDASFQASTSTASQQFTIVQAATTTSAASSASTVAPTASVTIGVAVAADSIGVPPSGTVQLFNGSTAIGSAVSVTQGYSPSTGLAQSTASFTLTGNQISPSARMAKLNREGFPWAVSGGAAALACVFFFAIPARRCSWRALLSLVVFALIVSGAVACGGGDDNNNNGGASSITAKYSGDTNYSASTSTAITITVTQ